jgi:hypothetical protein
MDSLDRLLPSIVRQAEDSPHARECAALTAWNAAVGAGVRRVCSPSHLDGRRLYVDTVDQTWKVQLERLAPQLIFKINSILGAPVVTLILFRVNPGALTPSERDADHSVPPGLQSAVAASLTADAESIPDPELRDLFLRAASKCLARTEAEAKKRQ